MKDIGLDKHHTSIAWCLSLAISVAALLLLTGTMVPSAEAAPFCTLTSDAARQACFHETKDDYWIAQGKCLNVSDDNERRACRTAATAAKKDAMQLCRDQRQARLDVCRLLYPQPPQERYDPPIVPANFVNPDDIGGAVTPNQYFPLVAGATRTYAGNGQTITVTVTNLTKVIAGVTCRVVQDVVVDDGSGLVIEDTEDWFAQDVDGNVWYFGEIVQDFENGELVSIDGTWKAGVDGAKIGIIMKAAPVVGETYRQEFSLGNAEDVATVLSVTASETVPAAACAGTCVQTADFTPIDPGVVENKYYAPGVGLILEIDMETGARTELISIVN